MKTEKIKCPECGAVMYPKTTTAINVFFVKCTVLILIAMMVVASVSYWAGYRTCFKQVDRSCISYWEKKVMGVHKESQTKYKKGLLDKINKEEK